MYKLFLINFTSIFTIILILNNQYRQNEIGEADQITTLLSANGFVSPIFAKKPEDPLDLGLWTVTIRHKWSYEDLIKICKELCFLESITILGDISHLKENEIDSLREFDNLVI